MKLLIPKTVVLGFDPATVTDPELCEVIADPQAWQIWLCWRPSHIVSQHFNRACLEIAHAIRERLPANASELLQCFRGCDFPYNNVRDWVDQFYLYYRGFETLNIEVRER